MPENLSEQIARSRDYVEEARAMTRDSYRMRSEQAPERPDLDAIEAVCEAADEWQAVEKAATDYTVALDKLPGGWRVTLGGDIAQRLLYGDGRSLRTALAAALSEAEGTDG